MKDLMKLLESKGMDIDDESKKAAKLEVIKELLADMGGMIGDDMDSMQQVTVAADSPENMEKGLEKAEEIVSMMPESEMSDKAYKDSDYAMSDMEDEDEEM